MDYTKVDAALANALSGAVTNPLLVFVHRKTAQPRLSTATLTRSEIEKLTEDPDVITIRLSRQRSSD